MIPLLLLANAIAVDGFPPPLPFVTRIPSLINFVLALMAAGAVVFLIVTAFRKARLVNIAVWLALGCVTIALAIGHQLADSYAPTDWLQVLGPFIVLLALCEIFFGLVRIVYDLPIRGWKGILVSLTLTIFGVVALNPPAIAARPHLRRLACKDQLRELGIAMHEWHLQHGRLPDLQVSNDGQPVRSWRVELLPYIEQTALYEQYRKEHAWDAAENLPVAQTRLGLLQCPSVMYRENEQDQAGRYFTHYLAVTGPGTIFAGGNGMSMEEISAGDGTSKTMLVVEASGRNVVWTAPRDADTSMQPIGINLPGATQFDSPGLLSSHHSAGVNVMMADASVYTIPKNMDPKILRQLTTTHGGDPRERGF